MTEYINKTQYTCLQLTDYESEKKILAWIAPLLDEGTDISEVDLSSFRADSMWALRAPAGNVAFTTAGDFLLSFEEVEGSNDDVDPMAVFEDQLFGNKDL